MSQKGLGTCPELTSEDSTLAEPGAGKIKQQHLRCPNESSDNTGVEGDGAPQKTHYYHTWHIENHCITSRF
ncbi:hypothetical protein Y1Q_0023304 [Alligator mississippiensis]|uniref:Uncharacterized protein n=1 Tax=Alligator mississippiensis TaxID=8496 RepID=A0A151NP74_ALLMI|nr:hypothetical protein Y1Q_0023304 [Alligator mississippiensis]